MQHQHLNTCIDAQGLTAFPLVYLIQPQEKKVCLVQFLA